MSSLSARGDDASPEEQELAFKRAELARLQEEVVARELKATLLRSQIEGFAHARLLRLGRLYERVDELEVRIAERLVSRSPGDAVAARRLQEARARWRASTENASDAEERGPGRSVRLTPELKAAYRKAALQFHPDLGRSESEFAVRHSYMVRLNEAYTSGDAEAIDELLAAWEAQRGPPEELGVAEQLVRVIRAISRLRKSLDRLEAEIAHLCARPDHNLMVRATREEAEGRDLLAETERSLRSRIASLEARLDGIDDEGE